MYIGRNRCLNGGFVWDWCDSFRLVLFRADGASLTGLYWLPLQKNVASLSLSGSLLLGVSLHTVDKLLSTGRVLNVVDADVDSLLEVSVSNDLVDDDPEGRLGNVVDNTSLSVIVLVGHTAELSVAAPMR